MRKRVLLGILRYQAFYRLSRPYLGWMILAGIVTSLVGGLDAALAWAIRPFMDVMLSDEQLPLYVVYAPLIIIAFTVFQGAGKLASNCLTFWVSGHIIMNVKSHLFEKLLHNEAAYFDGATSGKVLLNYNHDVDAACRGICENGKMLVLHVTSTVTLGFVLFYNSWQLATVALAFMILAVYPITRIRKILREMNSRSIDAGTNLLTHYNESFNGNRVIASYNLYRPFVGRLRATMEEQCSIVLKIMLRGGSLSIFMHFVVALGIALALLLQRHLAAAQNMTPGNFASFIAAMIMLYSPIKRIGSNLHHFYGSYMAVERVVASLNRVPAILDRPEAQDMRPLRSQIRFENVGFSYQRGTEVLNHFNLVIEKGEMVALVGESGAGKSTVASLLARFYDVTSGKITVDGVDIRDMRLESLRQSIAVVFQDNFLFDGTIRENILVGKPEAGEAEVNAAVDAACLRGFVDGLESGLDTLIGERGILLSGGEKQRIAIARAFIKNAPIVILDEATSSLDNNTELLVQKAIENLECDKTVLIIAHRLSSIAGADRIVVMDNGKVVESGKHSELMVIPNGVYFQLYNIQRTA